MVGINRVSTENLFSGLNNFAFFGVEEMDSSISSFFGYSQE